MTSGKEELEVIDYVNTRDYSLVLRTTREERRNFIL